MRVSFDSNDPELRWSPCAVCGGSISQGQWYARIFHEDLRVALCDPFCAGLFIGNSRHYAAAIRERLVLGRELPPSGN